MSTFLAVLAGIAAAVIGCGIGLTELVSRYRDEPQEALRAPAALLYIVINGAVSAIAFVILVTVAQGMVPGTGGEQLFYAMVMAGFGAMALMRTAILRVKISGEEVGIGSSVFIETLLKVADRGVDRHRAMDRAQRVPGIVRGLPLDFATGSLPFFCLDLLQNLDPKERQEIEKRIEEVARKDVQPEEMQSVLAALPLQYTVGTAVLEATVKALDHEIKALKQQREQAKSRVLSIVTEEPGKTESAAGQATPSDEGNPSGPTSSRPSRRPSGAQRDGELAPPPAGE